MSHVAVRATFRYARHHRQDRLFAIEGLNLALLINTEDEGSVRRRKVKADDIAYFVDEQRIARQLERLATVRLQAERHPHAADRGVGKASFRCHRADRPVRRVDRCRAQCSIDHGSNLIIDYRSRSTGASLIKQTIAAILQKSASPLANGVFVETKFGSHILARQAVRTSQNRAALASPNKRVPPHSAPTARSAGLFYLLSP